MRIAVIGAGIAGMGCAWLLSRQHRVVLFEAADRLGGHTNTHRVVQHGREYLIDSGFMVFNPRHYPLLTRLFEDLDVRSQPTTMSFSVQNARSGLEYNAGNLDGLFCQRRNLASPRFWRLIADITRFYRQAPALLRAQAPGPSLGEYLREHRYSKAFIDDHLVPMVSALWSSPPSQVLQFPARYLVEFMASHNMLQIHGRPDWRVVSGGSRRYIAALERDWSIQLRLDASVQSVYRLGDSASVTVAGETEHFDQVVLACHADQALALLGDASDAERDILGAIRFQRNETVLHTDARLLPASRKAWAAWNVYIPEQAEEACTASYWMNLLQSIDSPDPFVVSLNRSAAIDPKKVIARMSYEHPIYCHASVAARQRRSEINGVNRIWFAGAWWGWGFHEDGLRSATEIAGALGVQWP